MWRDAFALVDLDGDGRPEIVAPPPRFAAGPLRIFRRDSAGWAAVAAVFDDPEGVGFGCGGLAAADLDGDGRPDLVMVQTLGGPAVAYNQGGFRFQVRTEGLPREVSSRAVVTGDVDGDGRTDLVTVSSEPEALWKEHGIKGPESRTFSPRPGYTPGYDLRMFLGQTRSFVEVHEGLERACFGYSLALHVSPPGDGMPFVASACRHLGWRRVIHEFDRERATFRAAAEDVSEAHAFHLGVAVGRLGAAPAAFFSYVKVGPEGTSPAIDGYGVSAYVREPGGWRRQRLLKTLGGRLASSALAVADLDGDGLDDVVFADDAQSRLRILLQRGDGQFEEPEPDERLVFVNQAVALRIGDLDGDGRPDVVLMSQHTTGSATRSGGLRVFRNLGPTTSTGPSISTVRVRQ